MRTTFRRLRLIGDHWDTIYVMLAEYRILRHSAEEDNTFKPWADFEMSITRQRRRRQSIPNCTFSEVPR